MPTIDIYRVKVDPAKVGRLLEIHEQAVAESAAILADDAMPLPSLHHERA